MLERGCPGLDLVAGSDLDRPDPKLVARRHQPLLLVVEGTGRELVIREVPVCVWCSLAYACVDVDA